MFKKITILILAIFFLFSCSKKEKIEAQSDLSDEEMALNIYTEGLEALKKGDAFFASKKFKEVESLLPQSGWAAKASLMASFADYSRSSYSDSKGRYSFC